MSYKDKIPTVKQAAEYGEEAMKRGARMRVTANGKHYHVLGSWSSKATAVAWAGKIRKAGYLVRVVPWDGNRRFRIMVRRKDGREYEREFTPTGSTYHLER